MNSFNLMYSCSNQETVGNLHEAERLMNLSISKFQMACQHDLPLRRSLLIASVLNRAQRAAADAIASLDCSKPQEPPCPSANLLPFKSDEHLNEDIEMHILGNDLLSEILCADDKPSADFDQSAVDSSDNLRKRPRESVVMESVKPPPISELHDSKRLKETEELSVPLSDEWSDQYPSYNSDMWIMPSIWTTATPVLC
ncbi:hypothetical protein ACHWQZ_G016372 [Mnemiopsis leidyi]